MFKPILRQVQLQDGTMTMNPIKTRHQGAFLSLNVVLHAPIQDECAPKTWQERLRGLAQSPCFIASRKPARSILYIVEGQRQSVSSRSALTIETVSENRSCHQYHDGHPNGTLTGHFPLMPGLPLSQRHAAVILLLLASSPPPAVTAAPPPLAALRQGGHLLSVHDKCFARSRKLGSALCSWSLECESSSAPKPCLVPQFHALVVVYLYCHFRWVMQKSDQD